MGEGIRHRVFARWLAAVAMALLACTGTAPAHARSETALFLTDVHFDPFADAATARALERSAPDRWRAILADRRGTMRFDGCGDEASVTDASLFGSAMTAIRRRRFAFTVLNGDLLVHQFQCRFQSLFPHADAASYRDFAAHTVEFVIGEVSRATRGRPVYLALGNHDSGCGNYRRDDRDPFLRAIAPAVARAARGGRQRRALEQSFAANGWYEVSAPGPGARISLLVVDTSLWSRRAETCDGQARTGDNGQLAWLRSRSAAITAAGGTVWMIGHIPPGIDPRDSATRGAAVRYLRDDNVAQTLAQAGTPIDLALFGHTHMDEWRLFGRVPVRISPALSPSSGNRPAFTVASIGENGSLQDYTVIAYAEAQRQWVIDHGFAQTFGLIGFNAENLAMLDRQIENGDEQTITKYNNIYTSGGAVAIPGHGNWLRSAGCAFSSMTNEEYAQCFNRGH